MGRLSATVPSSLHELTSTKRYQYFSAGRISIAPKTLRRDPCSNLDRGIDVFGLEDEVSPDGAPNIDEGSFRRQRLAVLHAHGGCFLGKAKRGSWRDARRLIQ